MKDKFRGNYINGLKNDLKELNKAELEWVMGKLIDSLGYNEINFIADLTEEVKYESVHNTYQYTYEEVEIYE